jgi:hypothetical protein
MANGWAPKRCFGGRFRFGRFVGACLMLQGAPLQATDPPAPEPVDRQPRTARREAMHDPDYRCVLVPNLVILETFLMIGCVLVPHSNYP